MAAVENAMIARWLLSLLCFVLVMAGLMVFLVMHWRLHKPAIPAAEQDGDSGSSVGTASPELPQAAMKRANTWLAVKSTNVRAVQSALALHNSKPCSWAEGVSGTHDLSLFVSPPVSGWILVIGPALPDPADDVDVCFRFLADLSRKLGHIQFFHINGIVNHHAWVRADAGRIIRAYAWAGKTLWNQGPLTPAENILEMRCYNYGEPSDTALFAATDSALSNTEKVHLLAGRWSVDPDEAGWRTVTRDHGIIGEVWGLY